MHEEKKKTWLDQVTKTLQKIEGKTVVVGCSGGPDSMVLLDIVRRVKSSTVIVCHVHHGLRESATRDQKIVTTYCKKHNIRLETITPEVKKEAKKAKMTVEEYARKVRQDFFESVRKKHNATYIITAHHADDQTETLLYRITKGTSITGLVGIGEVSWYYMRPFIRVSKKEILDYAKKKTLSFGHDETNDDTSIPRNRLRHNVVPELQKINPEMSSAVARLGQNAQELKMSFDAFFTEVIEEKCFSLDWYHSLPLGFQHELLRFLYEQANGSTHGLSTSLIEELDRFLSTRNGGKKEVKNMKLEKKQGKVYLTNKIK